jgi:hypothetical protein
MILNTYIDDTTTLSLPVFPLTQIFTSHGSEPGSTMPLNTCTIETAIRILGPDNTYYLTAYSKRLSYRTEKEKDRIICKFILDLQIAKELMVYNPNLKYSNYHQVFVKDPNQTPEETRIKQFATLTP